MSDTPRTDAVYFRSGSTKYDLAGEMKELERENAALRAELEAQAVVNGKGGEREAKLLAEVAELRGALEESQQYGRNHANANMKLLSVISRIRRAVDEQPKKSQAMRLKDVGNLCGEVLGKEFRNESHFGVYPA